MIAIVCILAAGIALGRILPEGAYRLAGDGAQYLLYVLVALVGVELAGRSDIFAAAKARWKQAILTPLAVALGSVAGGMAAGVLCGLGAWQAAAIAGGYGWYSLSSVVLAQVDAQLGAMAFLANVLREILAIILMPLLCRRLSPWAGIAAGGATAMDVTLGVVSQHAGAEYAPFAFISGAVLTALTPVTLGIIMALAGV